VTVENHTLSNLFPRKLGTKLTPLLLLLLPLLSFSSNLSSQSSYFLSMANQDLNTGSKAAEPSEPAAAPQSNQPVSTQLLRQRLERAADSYTSVPPAGSILTGKQEHCKLRSTWPFFSFAFLALFLPPLSRGKERGKQREVLDRLHFIFLGGFPSISVLKGLMCFHWDF
jgi:hypothetical protein